jgi:polyisoprenoid-binding protein YceI
MTKSSVSEIPGFMAGTWEIDQVCSEIAFISRHFTFGKARGTFDRFRGIIVTHEDFGRSWVTAKINASSIRTNGPKRDARCRSARFLDVTQFPAIEFESTAVYLDGTTYYVGGDLTIRGVTRPATLQIGRWCFIPDFAGRTRAHFCATTEISRNDFGVRPKGALELLDNALVLSNTVTLALTVEACFRIATFWIPTALGVMFFGLVERHASDRPRVHRSDGPSIVGNSTAIR